ncbi:PCI domain-containing protein [Xylariomycetidae sp. FL2044]|nr:PCI domain-containing protein [Xylariomycetidae sp. FL2044]
MAQTKALNALEPFLALTKSAAAPRAAADLVTQATSNPNTYVFSELLQTPQIQALAQSPSYASHLTLLEIFSYGTYTNYTTTPNLPTLNAAQTLKLRQLSLLTLARDPLNLTYASLQQQLGLPDARSLEDIIISSVYAELIEAQLDPRNQTVLISSVSPLRDLAPNSIPSMISSLQTWSGRCTSTLENLELQIALIKAAAAARHNEKIIRELTQAKLVEEEKSAEAGAHGRGAQNLLQRGMANLRDKSQRYNKRGPASLDSGHEDDEAMDLDEEEPDDGEGGGGSGGLSGGQGKKRASRRKL